MYSEGCRFKEPADLIRDGSHRVCGWVRSARPQSQDREVGILEGQKVWGRPRQAFSAL